MKQTNIEEQFFDLFDANQEQVTTPYRENVIQFSFKAKKLNAKGYKTFDFKLITSEPMARCLFQVLYTMSYMIDHVGNQPKTRRYELGRFGSKFLRFINTQKKISVTVLKDFQKYEIDVNNLKPQSTVAPRISVYIKEALLFETFAKTLSDVQINFLYKLSKTKLMSNVQAEQKNLTNWFAQFDWLQQDVRGVGQQKFQKLSSPKILINSLRLFSATIILEFAKMRHESMSLFLENQGELNKLDPLHFCIGVKKSKDEANKAKSGWLRELNLLISKNQKNKYTQGFINTAIAETIINKYEIQPLINIVKNKGIHLNWSNAIKVSCSNSITLQLSPTNIFHCLINLGNLSIISFPKSTSETKPTCIESINRHR